MFALIAAVAMEALMRPEPPGFVVGYNLARDGNSIVEQVPAGETVEKWTRMVTTQRFAGVARRTDGNGFLQLMIDRLQQACPGAKIAYRRASGKAAQMRIDCRSTPLPGSRRPFSPKRCQAPATCTLPRLRFVECRALRILLGPNSIWRA